MSTDIKYALRSLIKRPGIALVAVNTLAFGIGANTTILSVINALVLSPPNIVNPDSVVAIWQSPVGSRSEME